MAGGRVPVVRGLGATGDVHMRVWLPDCVTYRSFPLVVGTVGLAGCLAGSPASLALGGVLILYSGGVYCLRR